MRGMVETCRLLPMIVTFAIGVAVLGALQCAGDRVRLGAGRRSPAGWSCSSPARSPAPSPWSPSGCVVGRIEAMEHPLWSSFVWRNEVSDTFVETVAAPWFARAASGTPVMNLWLRALGAKIGRGVWCETYWLPEADLVTVGDGATVSRGCVVQTHLFHDRIMRLDTVILEDGRDARAALRGAARREDRRGRHRRPRLAGDARRRGTRRRRGGRATRSRRGVRSARSGAARPPSPRRVPRDARFQEGAEGHPSRHRPLPAHATATSATGSRATNSTSSTRSTSTGSPAPPPSPR